MRAKSDNYELAGDDDEEEERNEQVSSPSSLSDEQTCSIGIEISEIEHVDPLLSVCAGDERGVR